MTRSSKPAPPQVGQVNSIGQTVLAMVPLEDRTPRLNRE
jgi:hypothetical protein